MPPAATKAAASRRDISASQTGDVLFQVGIRSAHSFTGGRGAGLRSLAEDQPGQRRHPADQPGVESELPAVVLLVRNAVVDPREARPALAVESGDELQHRELS